MKMSLNTLRMFWKFISFFSAIILGGLIQVWVLMIIAFIISTLSHSLLIESLILDGGLFFFATSLESTSILELADKKGIRSGMNFFLTFVTAILVFFPAIICYVTIVVKDHEDFLSISMDNLSTIQYTCVFVAIAYWFYVGVSTGLFHVTSHNQH